MATDMPNIPIRSVAEQMPAEKPPGFNLVSSVQDFSAKFFGVSFSAAAVTLVVFPFGMHTATEVFSKLMVALVLGFVGIAIWQSTFWRRGEEIEVDLQNSELRIRDAGKRVKSPMRSVKFADISRLELRGETFKFWTGSNKALATLTLSDPQAHQLLREALQKSGHNV